ncbi:MAG: asparagine synthase C-terminal domain-containing protein, partial [Myxococcota bacterium]
LSQPTASAAIAAAAQQQRPDQQLQTFSFAPRNQLASRFGARHTEDRLDPAIVEAALVDLAAADHAPLTRWSAVRTWALAGLMARFDVHVGITDVGADILFGGRPIYGRHQRRAPLGRIPALHRLRRTRPWPRAHQRWTGLWAPEDIGAQEIDFEHIDAHGAESGKSTEADAISAAIGLDVRVRLPHQLQAQYRAGRAHGVRLRAPLASGRMVEMTADMPTEMKRGLLRDQVVLRAVVRGWLPGDLPAPPRLRQTATVMLDGPCAHLLHGLRGDLVRPAALAATRAAVRRGDPHAGERLWALLVLSRWLET